MQPVDRTDGDRSFIEDARRRQIVTAAIAAIAEEGYSRASFVRIAARASISPGLITYHFKTKENLIREVLGHIDARLDRAMEGGPEPLEGFEDGLRRIVTGHVTYCASHPQEMVARREVLSAALPPALQEHVARGTRRAGPSWSASSPRGSATGSSAPSTPRSSRTPCSPRSAPPRGPWHGAPPRSTGPTPARWRTCSPRRPPDGGEPQRRRRRGDVPHGASASYRSAPPAARPCLAGLRRPRPWRASPRAPRAGVGPRPGPARAQP
ncbi:TetR family transcriptional regulator [Nocardiopsis sp. ARC36]